MDYYYAEEGKRVGPVTKEDLKALIQSKKINARTLIWRTGMADWQELGKVFKGVPQAEAPPDSTPTPATRSACSQCGRGFPEEDMIRFQDQWVCGACKPIFIQKIKEGAQVDLTMNYAGFWLRFGAWIIDYIILLIVNTIINIPLMVFVFSYMQKPDANPSAIIIFQLITSFVSLVFHIGYEVWFIGKYGATPGKMACKVKVVVSTGDKVSYLRSLGRFFAKWVSALTLFIGYIMAGFDREKRALHDMICDTRVIIV